MSSHTLTPRKSEGDTRAYRVVTLSNGLVATLVQDTNTDKAAVAMDVGVGHFSDPEELPGLAHFLEHMLFLGSELYPGENDYNELLNKHGGSSNAWTGAENTCYFFDVSAAQLKTMMPLFAAFFKCPLFSESCTERELNAVENEHKKNENQDFWRSYQLLKNSCRSDHSMSKFGTGNKATLHDIPASKGIAVRDELIKFHATYYSADIMKLCIIGHEDLDTLQSWAEELFAPIKSLGKPRPSFPPNPVAPENLGKRFDVVPVKDLRKVYLSWPTPSAVAHYKVKPLHGLSHLLGHEGKGSVLSVLKERGWANELVAGAMHTTTCFAFFGVNVDLTDEGLEHVDDVVQVIYEYVARLRSADSAKWTEVFEELRDVDAMNFRFKGNESPYRYCSSVTGAMQKYAPEDVLTGPWLTEEFDEALVREYLGCLRPDNMRMQVASKTFEGKTQLKERWYGTEYSEHVLDSATLARWAEPATLSPELHLPERNNFIATDFTIRGTKNEAAAPPLERILEAPLQNHGETQPTKLVDNERLQFWFKTDDQFLRPKASVKCRLRCPELLNSPTTSVLGSLFTRLVNDALNEYAYDASVAGLNYNLSPAATGLELSISGYSHKLPVLFERILDKIANLPVREERFQLLREKFRRQLTNFDQEQPYRHAMHHFSLATDDGEWDVDSKLAVIDGVTPADLEAFMPRLLGAMHVEALCVGNFTEEVGLVLANMITDKLAYKPLAPSQIPVLRIVELAAGVRAVCRRDGKNPDDDNSALELTFQVGPNELQTKAPMDMLKHLMSEPCFQQLRTQEQLGYLVWSGDNNRRGILALRIILQSSEYDAEHLWRRAEAFLHNNMRPLLVEMSDEDFEANKTALLATRLEPDKTIRRQANRYWSEIVLHRFDFERRYREVEALQKVTKDDVVAFYDEYVVLGAPQRRNFVSLVQSTKPKQPKEDGDEQPTEAAADIEILPPPEDNSPIEQVTDFAAFQRRHGLYPCCC